MPNRPKMVWVKCDVTPDKLTPEFVKRAVQLDKTSRDYQFMVRTLLAMLCVTGLSAMYGVPANIILLGMLGCLLLHAAILGISRWLQQRAFDRLG